MKKNLLIAVALVATIGASAQVAPIGKKIPAPTQCGKMMKSADFGKLNIQKVAKVKANAPAIDNIYGEYLYTYFDSYNGVEATSVGRFTIKEASGTMDLKYYTNNDGSEGTPTFEYNVEIDNFSYDGTVVYGAYDEESGEIFIPVQDAIEVTEANGFNGDYGPAVLTAFYEGEDGNQYYGAELIFVIGDDGSIELGEDLLGWYSYLPEDLAPSGNPYAFNAGEDLQLFTPNGTMDFRTRVNFLKDEVLSESYDPAHSTINVQDFGTQLVVSGFMKQFYVTIDLNDDGTCSLPFPQLVMDYEQEIEEQTYTGIYIYGSDPEGYPGLEEESLLGYVDGNKVRFYADAEGGANIWNEDGSLKSDAYNGYIFLGFQPGTDAEGKKTVYGYGWNCLLDFEWTDGNSDPDPQEPTGIENANNTLEYKLKNTKTYNLMGQQVDRKAVKGLMIRDGKKYIAK
jgi:hypothetical protein